MTFIGCGSREVPDTSLEDARKKGEIVVGFDDGFVPMGFRNEKGDIAGFDIDLAREAAKRLGLTVAFRACDWKTIFTSLTNREIDLIWNGLSVTQQRSAWMALSRPYLTNRQIIVVKKGAKLAGRADLPGKKVGVQQGSNSEQCLHAVPGLVKKLGALKRFGDNSEALLELAAGRLDAVVVDEVVGRYFISRKAGAYAVLTDDFGSETYAVGLRAGDRKLRDAIDGTLDAMRRDGSFERIRAMWFSRQATPR